MKTHISLPKTVAEDVPHKMRKWACSLLHGLARNSVDWVQSLGKVATTNAEILEKKATARSIASWRAKLGATAQDKAVKPRPSSSAYRW